LGVGEKLKRICGEGENQISARCNDMAYSLLENAMRVMTKFLHDNDRMRVMRSI